MLGSNEEAHGVEALVLKEKFAASPDATTPDALDIKTHRKGRRLRVKRFLYFINEKISKLQEDERENIRDNITDLTLAENSVFLQEDDTEKLSESEPFKHKTEHVSVQIINQCYFTIFFTTHTCRDRASDPGSAFKCPALTLKV